jgi:phosphoribosylformimino-5-aminoimidazole carboxamide ribotide isomerase
MKTPDRPGVRLIPVLDVQKGIVVRAVAGRRGEYRPILSQFAPSSDPLVVAAAFRDQFGFTELYLADLDAIGGCEPNWQMYLGLVRLGLKLTVDTGLRTVPQCLRMKGAGVSRIVVALETSPDRGLLEHVIGNLRPMNVTFSLDLRNGLPLGKIGELGETDPVKIAGSVIDLGYEQLIVLDLASVGGGKGTLTEELCRQIHQQWPDVELIAGGGVCCTEDAQRLGRFGVRGVLVASALHDGRIRPGDIR